MKHTKILLVVFLLPLITTALAGEKAGPFPLVLQGDLIQSLPGGFPGVKPFYDPFNVRVNLDQTRQVHNEEQIVANPLNPDNLVGIWRDFRFGYRQVYAGYSFDGGKTWGEYRFVEPIYEYDSDPGLTVDVDGNFYAVILSFNSTYQPNGLFVYKSTDGGVNWSGPYTVIDGVPGVFEDKELMACDRGPTSLYQGNLYVVWARFYSTQIMCCRSTDGGINWVGPVQVSDQSGVQWPTPAVGPSGELYVAWCAYYPTQIRYAISTDGGVSFGSERVLTNTDFDPGDYINGGILVFPYPAMDVDITGGADNGNIYVAYMDYGPGWETDMYFRRSTDGGNSWSERIRINDDPYGNGCDQFHPWIWVDEEGIITVVWLDRRNDPNNLYMDCYLTRSYDGGLTFTPNIRVSTVSSDPTAGLATAGLLGEYIGVTSMGAKVHPLWTDTRLGDQDVFTATLDFSNNASVLVMPNDPPVIIPPEGGQLTYDGTLIGNVPFNQRVDIWAMVDVPGMGMYGPVLQYNGVRLDAYEVIKQFEMRKRVPGGAPAGEYTYIAYVGDYPSAKVDSSFFSFTKSGVGDLADFDWVTLKGWFPEEDELSLPSSFTLKGNHPNPFNLSTTITFELSQPRQVTLEIYNLSGERVSTLLDGPLAAGTNSVDWSADGVASGIYYCKLSTFGESQVARMVLLK